ncbi:MAG: hypothetical protein JWN01_71 [Patescibacteria group bacterium]|nr:hypothetical protein [Patescibacteria group bacterium]
MRSSLERSLWYLLVFRAVQYSNIYTPFLIYFLLSESFTQFRAFQVAYLALASMGVFQVHTGYLADRLGRKRVLLLGCMLTIVGLAMYATTNTFGPWVLVGAVVAGLGWSCQDGAEMAIANDICLVLTADKPETWKKVRERFELRATTGAISVGLVVGGLIGATLISTLGLRSTLWAQVAAYTVGFLLACLVKEPGVSGKSKVASLSQILKGVWRHPRLMAILAFSVAMGTLASGATKVVPLYYTQIQIGDRHLGIGSYPFAWVGLVGSGLVFQVVAKRHSHRFGRTTGLAVLAMLGVATYAAMASSVSLVGLASMLVLFFIGPMCLPQMNVRVAQLVDSTQQATVSSLRRLLALLAMAGTGLFSGWVVDAHGVAAGLWVTGLVCGAFTGLAIVALAVTGKGISTEEPDE